MYYISPDDTLYFLSDDDILNGGESVLPPGSKPVSDEEGKRREALVNVPIDVPPEVQDPIKKLADFLKANPDVKALLSGN